MHFCYKSALKGPIPLSILLHNSAWGRKTQVRTLAPNFTVVALKMRAYSLQNRQNLIFGINLPQRGISPLSNFYKIWHGKESQVRTFTLNFTIVIF